VIGGGGQRSVEAKILDGEKAKECKIMAARDTESGKSATTVGKEGLNRTGNRED